ncbi:hypothetical protein N9Q68_02025, partial [Polaribacter sp.]|nr:hypothetical protein [Polaribacter sp.]
HMKKLVLIAIIVLNAISTINAQEKKETFDLTIEFSGMKSDKGNLFVALFNTKMNFLKKRYREEIIKIKDKKSILIFKNLCSFIFP